MPYTAFLTSSNPHHDLRYIKEEFISLNTAFSSGRIADVVKPIINADITDKAVLYANLGSTDIRLFHFSGHAGDGRILMANGLSAGAAHIVNLMQNAQNLRLVFLNGCATYTLVDKFLENGAKIVIGTKARVFDSIAANFSARFYEAMCVSGFSVRQAFEHAKMELRTHVQNKIAELKKLNGLADGPADEERRMLEHLLENDGCRHISKDKTDAKDLFEWGIYCKNENDRKEYESWTLVTEATEVNDEGAINNDEAGPRIHHYLAFDFLKTMSQSAINARGHFDKEDDPRIEAFEGIEQLDESALAWNDEATETLISKLTGMLMYPLRTPFAKYINHGKDKWRQLQEMSIRELQLHLQYQVGLYRTFMRLSTLTMLSDFMESCIHPEVCNNDPIKSIFNHTLQKTPELHAQLQELLNGVKDLNDINFSIEISRNIHSFLETARKLANSIDEYEDDEGRKYFGQFVEEYEPDKLLDRVHSVLMQLTNLVEDDHERLQEATANTLRAYCEKAETALIDLFKHLEYVLKYDILTVGKVEASRQRDKRAKAFSHDLVISGHFSPYVHEEKFAENYSVILITHREALLGYLSLSPFMIDIGPFFDEIVSKVFYFAQVKEDYLEYYNYGHSSPKLLKIKLNSPARDIKDPKDTTFLILPDNVFPIYDRSLGTLKAKVRQQFARVRDQFLTLSGILPKDINTPLQFQ